MKLIMTILLLIGGLSCANVLQAQHIKARVNTISFESKNITTGEWFEVSERKEVDLIINLHLYPNEIRIGKKQYFNILKDLQNGLDPKGNKIFKWRCINQDSIFCDVGLLIPSSEESSAMLYVEYDGLKEIYHIHILE